MCSGVATGWHGWTMSRGPGSKMAPESGQKGKWRKEKGKKEKKRKEKKRKEKKRKGRTKLFKYPDEGPTH